MAGIVLRQRRCTHNVHRRRLRPAGETASSARAFADDVGVVGAQPQHNGFPRGKLGRSGIQAFRHNRLGRTSRTGDCSRG